MSGNFCIESHSSNSYLCWKFWWTEANHLTCQANTKDVGVQMTVLHSWLQCVSGDMGDCCCGWKGLSVSKNHETHYRWHIELLGLLRQLLGKMLPLAVSHSDLEVHFEVRSIKTEPRHQEFPRIDLTNALCNLWLRSLIIHCKIHFCVWMELWKFLTTKIFQCRYFIRWINRVYYYSCSV